ncbi:MAG: carboxypeptidase-like regulatory domain-containing protein [Terriglobales bacterium]
MRTRRTDCIAVLILVAILFGHGWAFACVAVEKTLTVSCIAGRIVDESGAAIANADIRLIRKSDNASFTTTTDSNGRYKIEMSVAGPYELRVTAVGFQSGFVPLHLKKNSRKVCKQRIETRLLIGGECEGGNSHLVSATTPLKNSTNDN